MSKEKRKKKKSSETMNRGRLRKSGYRFIVRTGRKTKKMY